jgi:hypothetical protein
MVHSILGDGESQHLPEQITAAVSATGWDHGGPHGIRQSVFTKNPVGIQIEINQADAEAGRVPFAATVLIDAMISLALLREPKGFKTRPSSQERSVL